MDRRLVSPTETRTFLCLPLHTPTNGNRQSYRMTHTVQHEISCGSDKNEKTCTTLLENAYGNTRGTRTAKSTRADDKNIFFCCPLNFFFFFFFFFNMCDESEHSAKKNSDIQAYWKTQNCFSRQLTPKAQ